MSLCKLCNEDTEKYMAKIILGEVDPPKRVGIDMRYKTNVEICPSCGNMIVVGANMDYMKMLSDGYPPVTDEDLSSIDVNSLLDEMTLPGTHSEEVKVWVDSENFDVGQLDDLSEGITFDVDNYYRLTHFLLLDSQERKNAYGDLKCPVISLMVRDRSGSYIVSDGRRRLSLLFHLGAERIPVAMMQRDLDDIDDRGEELGIAYHTSK